MKKNMIWSNMNLDIADWEDYFTEEFDDELTEDEKYEKMHSLNNLYIEDEIENLNVPLNGRILVIADLGLWNGRRQGYKILDGNLNNIFSTNAELTEWYVEDGELRSTQVHHDGTNYLIYREIKEDRDLDKLTDMLYNGEEVSKQRLSSYTRSLAETVNNEFGW